MGAINGDDFSGSLLFSIFTSAPARLALKKALPHFLIFNPPEKRDESSHFFRPFYFSPKLNEEKGKRPSANGLGGSEKSFPLALPPPPAWGKSGDFFEKIQEVENGGS